MTLQDMIGLDDVGIVLEFAKFTPDNSMFPIGVWFDRDKRAHEMSPRIKIQQQRGMTDSNHFMTISAVTHKVLKNTKNTSKRNAVSKKYIDKVLDFININEDLIDAYYGINRETGKVELNNRIDEQDFRAQITERANKFFRN